MSLLNYVTYKYVVLKDARLGLTYYILVALILLYSVVEIVFNKGYLQVRSLPKPCRPKVLLYVHSLNTT